MQISQNNIKNLFCRYFEGKRLAILGFGLEGRSTFKLVRKFFPEMHIHVCDRNAGLTDTLEDRSYFGNSSWHLGDQCFDGLQNADIIMKSPGIPFKNLAGVDTERIKTQTALFLELFRKQVVGITGTKGKSTTVTLLQHILKKAGKDSLLAGNIGTPCFDLIRHVTPESIIVFEMSSHQLENLNISPHIAVLLNIFKEHLDHYESFEAYINAKLNIARWQKHDDFFIYNARNQNIASRLKNIHLLSNILTLDLGYAQGRVAIVGNDILYAAFGKEILFRGICNKCLLRGKHNLLNIAAAVAVATLFDVSEDIISNSVSEFPGLPHRLEYVGKIAGVTYYNDSIATIPEAAIEALKAIPETTTLILGGYDRNLDYTGLIEFLASSSSVQLILLIGDAGRRMYDLTSGYEGFAGKSVKVFDTFVEAVRTACMDTPSGKTVMLSPAAASYDEFTDFKERGERFKSLVREFNR